MIQQVLLSVTFFHVLCCRCFCEAFAMTNATGFSSAARPPWRELIAGTQRSILRPCSGKLQDHRRAPAVRRRRHEDHHPAGNAKAETTMPYLLPHRLATATLDAAFKYERDVVISAWQYPLHRTACAHHRLNASSPRHPSGVSWPPSALGCVPTSPRGRA